MLLRAARAARAASCAGGWSAIAAAVVLAPWTIYASARRAASSRSPRQRGGAVRRHLPARRRHDDRHEGAPRAASCGAATPSTAGPKTYKIPAADALEIFAERHPDLPRDEALQREARKNLIHYSTTQPVAFAKMQWAKAKRMWFFYYRGGGVHYISTPMRIWQVFLVLACGAGLLAGLIRRRDPVLGAVLLAIAYSTLSTRSWSPRPATTSR